MNHWFFSTFEDKLLCSKQYVMSPTSALRVCLLFYPVYTKIPVISEQIRINFPLQLGKSFICMVNCNDPKRVRQLTD